MNKSAQKLFIFFLLFLLNITLPAQSVSPDYNYALYNTTAQFIYSESVADSFLIYISVPNDYDESGNNYPVLYVLDGDIAFGMAASIARYLQIGGNIPELIVVGIGYGSVDKSAAEKRLRDYGPQQGEGAEKFRTELLPMTEL